MNVNDRLPLMEIIHQCIIHNTIIIRIIRNTRECMAYFHTLGEKRQIGKGEGARVGMMTPG